jgi:hypothetical protein
VRPEDVVDKSETMRRCYAVVAALAKAKEGKDFVFPLPSDWFTYYDQVRRIGMMMMIVVVLVVVEVVVVRGMVWMLLLLLLLLLMMMMMMIMITIIMAALAKAKEGKDFVFPLPSDWFTYYDQVRMIGMMMRMMMMMMMMIVVILVVVVVVVMIMVMTTRRRRMVMVILTTIPAVSLALTPQIRRPICLNDIMRNLKAGMYDDSVGRFASDVRLIFVNCTAFNGESSPIVGAADFIAAKFERLLLDWVLDPSPPPLELLNDELCQRCFGLAAGPIIKCGRCDAPRHHACVDGPVPTGGKVRGG